MTFDEIPHIDFVSAALLHYQRSFSPDQILPVLQSKFWTGNDAGFDCLGIHVVIIPQCVEKANQASVIQTQETPRIGAYVDYFLVGKPILSKFTKEELYLSWWQAHQVREFPEYFQRVALAYFMV